MEHSPFKEGECITCHNVHASEYPKLALKKGNTLCFDCHKEKGEKVSVNHAPVTVRRGAFHATPPMQPKIKIF